MKNRELLVKFISILLLVLSPVFFIFVIELSLNLYHFYLPSKYTESFNEALSKTKYRNLKLDRTLINDLKQNKIKIAVFGGSSAAGYASPHSFISFLENASPEPLIIHKYAKSGSPFVGFQSEILKIVAEYYDIIIIYAGHNEIWSHIYRNGHKTGEKQVLPNGYLIDVDGAINAFDRKLILIDSLLKNNNKNSLFFTNITNYIYFNSRLSNFTRKSINKITPYLTISSNKKNEQKVYPLVVDEPFINIRMKKKFLDDFEKEISNIKKIIDKDQKLIISTVLSNDFHPPLLDVKKFSTDFERKQYKKLILKLYGFVEEDNYSKLGGLIDDLSIGSNKLFLNSLICANESPKLYNCLGKAKLARLYDALPYRVIPDINDYIRKMNVTENLFIIDPTKKLNNSLNMSDYLSYFVDYQHPSSKGHAIIANEILNIIFPYKKIKIIEKDKSCNKFQIKTLNGLKEITLEENDHKHALKTNINWLKNTINSYSINYLSKFYKLKAEKELEKCFS